jgi:tetratricopeptide (TPR) repeat protein
MFAAYEGKLAFDKILKTAKESGFKETVKFKTAPSTTYFYKEAIKYLTRAIKLDPTYPYPYWFRGKCNYCLGFIEESAADHSNAIKYKPDQIEFYEDWEWSHEELLG